MATVPVVQNHAADSVHEEFLELVCGDEQLLRAEFDAIIAQEWGSRPPSGSSTRSVSGNPPPS
ncbi:MAG: hypothetical protein ACXVHC_00590, partial [Frankiaceae bacterium]